MGSFNGKGRNQGRVHRRGAKDRRFGFLEVESLEGRVLLATAPTITAVVMDPNIIAPGNDTGIVGDENTANRAPIFDGQVSAGSTGMAGLTVVAEFNSLHGGGLDLAPGPNGRGFVGSVDATATTNANGQFVIHSPLLFEGYTDMRLVVVGAPDLPPQAGLSSSFDHTFRIDNTAPAVVGASLAPGGAQLPPLSGSNNLASLSTLSLDVIDPASPASGALATPTQVSFPAVDPSTADNLANYMLVNTTTGVDESSFITSANFVATDITFGPGTTPTRTSTSDPSAGRIDLTFRPGLPMGSYLFAVHAGTAGPITALRDAAGNALNDTAQEGTPDFFLRFNLQSQPVFIRSLTLQNGSNVIGGPQSYFEVPAAGVAQPAPAPPTAVVINFSTPLNPNADYSNAVQLIGSADAPGDPADGNFGTLGVAGMGSTGTGFSRVAGTTVTLVDPSGKLPGDPGFSGTQLVLQLSSPLTPDEYRIYIPNTGANAIQDVFGNQLDGEFLGNLVGNSNAYVATPNFDGYTANPAPASGIYPAANYEDQLPDGTFRQGDMSGDGVAGGAFTTGFTVVPHGNIIYAQPGYVENPNNPATLADGSLAKPYPVLAPQATATTLNGGNLNSPVNFSNFDPRFDRAGLGHFASSALYAAQVLSANGPVVVVALPGKPQTNPVTGAVTTPTFVLQAPAGSDPVINDGSASVPFDTSLVFSPNTIVKLSNASLFVQNQGTSLQALGDLSDQVVFTSVNDNSVGGATSSTAPQGGDWGGIVFRNFDNLDNGRNVQFPIDGSLQGPSGQHAVSGADDALSILNFANVRYAGGAVPATQGIRYDAITLSNSRPTLTNDAITIPNGVTSGAQAAISGDLDSFREDDTARGPLIRRTTVANYSLNGIWVRPNLITGLTGVVEQSDAELYPNNPTSLGGNRNFTFDDPLPYILTSQLLIGEELLVNTGGETTFVNNRLYIQPGMIIKSQRGAGISVVNNAASINIGSRTSINQFDANPNFNFSTPGFQAESPTDSPVIFTSFFDIAATTPVTPVVDSANDRGTTYPLNPTGGAAAVPVQARWGSVGIQSGAVAVVNDAVFEYGGGEVNGPESTLPSQSVLSFITEQTRLSTPLNTASTGGGFFGTSPLFNPLAQLGTHAIITNNNFFNNFDSAMQIEPNGLLAADPTRPLQSGNPFFRNNVMQFNDIDGMSVVTNRQYILSSDRTTVFGPQELPLPVGSFNLTVNSVWDDSDLTYVLRGTVVLAGYYDNFNPFNPNATSPAPVPSTVAFGPEERPDITLTIQSTLPGTVLADGEVVPSPGESVLVKMFSDFAPNGAGSLAEYGSTGVGSTGNAGAGFAVGVDDAVDPPSSTGSPLVDPGAGSQIRILGIGGNESTGQSRVPVILTSLRDDTVGKTVRGVKMDAIWERNSIAAQTGATFDTHTPAAGDGGYIYYGGNSLTDFNLQDPRDGSLIDNATIRYMTRIEIQGGGIIDTNTNNGATPPVPIISLQTKLGQTPATQFNSAMAVTISDSNLDSFADAAVFVHPDQGLALVRDLSQLNVPGARLFPTRSTTTTGQGVVLYMVNNTISNSAVGVAANSDTVTTSQPDDEQLVLLNNTFYNDTIGMHTTAPVASTTTPLNDSVYWLAMDNIFSNSSNTAILSDGQEYGSQGQYNLFFQNGANLVANNPTPNLRANLGSVFGNPMFRNPAALDFTLMPGSAAIDAARSEIGPLPAGDAIYPTVDQVLTGTTGGIRTDPTTLTPPSTPGRSNAFNGNTVITDPRKQVTLPGTPGRTFNDEWVPILTSSPQAILGPASNAATFAYVPISGERDLLGLFRQDDPNVPNVGFGSRPFFDIGALEFRQFFPPQVVAISPTANVIAQLPDGTARDIYSVGGIAGVNQVPTSIQIKFNHQLDPATITSQSVTLVGSGGDGIFGNGNDTTFNLASSLLVFNPSTLILTINTAGLNLPTDEYELTLSGSGSNVIKDLQGNALDGEDTSNNDPNGTQKALPSGDGNPGGNFYLQFTIDNHPATLVPGSLQLNPATDTNRIDGITRDNLPAFSGTITDIFPPLNPLLGDTVFVDVFDYASGQFVQIGQGTTDTNGNFTVQATTPLPDSPYNVGADGLLGTPDDSGYGMARVRIVDQSGNVSVSQQPYLGYVIDTQSPQVTGFAPASSTLVTTTPMITFTTNKNVDPNSLNPNSVFVIGAGPDGTFGTTDDVFISLANVAFTVTPLKNGPQGPEQISFTLPAGLPNDQYEVVLKGTGSTPITDIAGNPLNGSGTPGSDLNFSFVFDNPAANHLIFAGPAIDVSDPTAVAGSRENPYPTISQAIAAAGVGDLVGVLPGVYTENVNMKSLVGVYSASLISTDISLQPGNALQTVLIAPAIPTAPATQNVTVTATNLISVPGLSTEISGLTIASPLIGNPATGAIDPTSVGVHISNSTVVISRSYIITSGIGVLIEESGLVAPTPLVQTDVIDGNIFGVAINDLGAGAVVAPMNIDGNTIVNNTVGVNVIASATSPVLADVADNIFWENHDQTAARNGAAVVASAPNKIALRGNMFSGNGPSDSNASDDVIGVGGGFNPATLGPTPDVLGNFTGNPAFVAPRDPRPGADGPAAFFIDANFDLTSASAAIDAAIPGFEPTYDFLYRSRVAIPGRGFPGTGPGDVGAFEFDGVGGLAVGGAFRVASTSLSGNGSPLADGRSISASALGNTVTVDFSGNVDQSTVTPADLVLSGSGLNPTNPAHATSLTWLDAHTVQFNLSGSFNSSGTVNVSIPAGTVQSVFHESMPGFSDSIQIANTPATSTTTVNIPSSQNGQTPAPASSPTKAGKKHGKVIIGKKHPVAHRHVVHHVTKAKHRK